MYALPPCASAEEGEELREGSDSHPVHELARPRRPRRATSAPETEAARQCVQEFLQRPHRCSLQVSSLQASANKYYTLF